MLFISKLKCSLSSRPLDARSSVTQVYYWREHSLHRHNGHHAEKHILDFSGNRTHGVLPGLHPFSLYLFNLRVYNGRGEGPPSATQQFETPEGGRRSLPTSGSA